MNDYSVLLIDDEEFFLEVLIEDTDWKSCGISTVKAVYSVKEAKEYLREHTVHILLCDVEMPGESGLDLIEWVTEYARFSGDPLSCIMLTCHPEYSFLRKAMQLGCQDYLLKPVDAEDLQKCLMKAVKTLNEQTKNEAKLPERQPESGKELIRQKVLPYIDDHLAEPFTVSDLADFVGLNPQYMMRTFKKVTGLSVLEYVTERKLKKAKELLLSTDISIEQISEKLGYFNYSYFFKLFKRAEGVSPGQYRKEYGK